MIKLTFIALAAAAALSATPTLAAANNLSVDVHGTNIDTSVDMVGTNSNTTVVAIGHDQKNDVVTGTCPEGTEPAPIVFVGSGHNWAIPYCETIID